MGKGERGTRVALVTGAAGVLGGAIVVRLQADGFAVGGLDGTGGGGDLSLTVDLTDRGETIAAVGRVTRELGPISVLVTAPEYHDAAPFAEMSRDRWERLLGAHLGSTVNAYAATVPAMVRAGHGTVVTISSWLALAGIPGEAYYAAATGSILAFTKSVALEVARNGVRVNCIAVGPLEADARLSRQPAPNLYVLPTEVADTVVFLVNDGDFFVGQVLSAAAGAVV
jgi:NAD(P)-dependent dehydrogenase (short-subunit alcohol dehydrogenase family)